VSTPERRSFVPMGRRAFLALLAGGGDGRLPGRCPPGRIFSNRSPQASRNSLADVLPVGGWRIYTISGSMAHLRFRSRGGSRSPGSSKKPLSLSYDDLLALPGAPEQISTFPLREPVGPSRDVHWGRCSLQATCSHSPRPLARGTGDPLRLRSNSRTRDSLERCRRRRRAT